MRNLHKWYLSLSVLSVGGMAALALSPGGRQFMRWLVQKMISSPEQLQQWNDNAEKELRRIQDALDRLAEAVQAGAAFHPIPGSGSTQ